MSSTPAIKDQQDWFLDQIVEWANRFGIEVGLTLSVNGMLVSGQMISGRNFFLELATEFRGDREEGSMIHTLAGLIERNKDVYEPFDLTLAEDKPADAQPSDTEVKADDNVDDDGDSAPPPPSYIHLRNAKIFTPGQSAIPGNRGMLWRGRISEISGFSIGSLSSE